MRSNIHVRFDAMERELAECRRLGVSELRAGKIVGGYIATDPISHIILDADEARRAGENGIALVLQSAAREVARAQAVALVAARRGHVRMKPKRIA
jgi:hypothetical protein